MSDTGRRGKPVSVADTRIAIGGAFRCCLETVATEFIDAGKRVRVGARSRCHHCDAEFVLTAVSPYPLWRLVPEEETVEKS